MSHPRRLAVLSAETGNRSCSHQPPDQHLRPFDSPTNPKGWRDGPGQMAKNLEPRRVNLGLTPRGEPRVVVFPLLKGHYGQQW